MTQRIIVAGDIHGCLLEFDELLRQVQYSSRDRLISLGDLMDRGPDPIGCVRRVRELGIETTFSNHENYHVRWRKHENARKATGKKNPMRPFKDIRARQNEELADDDIRWMESLPCIISLPGNFVAVHAGFRPNVPVYAQEQDDMIHIRYVDKDTLKPLSLGEDFLQPPNSVFWSREWCGPENVVYGHAVQGDDPFHFQRKGEAPFEVFASDWPEVVHTVGIDTGVCFGGRLTVMITEDDFKTWTYSQVQAKEAYAKPVVPIHQGI